MVALLAPARAAMASMVAAGRPPVSIRSPAAARMASRADSLRGRPRGRWAAAGPASSGTGPDAGPASSGTGPDAGPASSGTGPDAGSASSGTGPDARSASSGTGPATGPAGSGTGWDAVRAAARVVDEDDAGQQRERGGEDGHGGPAVVGVQPARDRRPG